MEKAVTRKDLDERDQNLKAYIDLKFEEKFQELKDHSEALVENVRDEVGGAYHDELEFVKDHVRVLERKVGVERVLE